MKYTRPLDDILGQKSSVRVLRYLADGMVEDSGRQIASAVGMSPTVVHRALGDLVAQGVVRTRRVGNTHLFALDEKNYLVEEMLLPLFGEERKLTERLALEVARTATPDAVSVILFGSVAAGSEQAYSDVDLLVIAEDSRAKKRLAASFSENAGDFMARFGNVLSPYIITRHDFKHRYRRGDGLIKAAVRQGRLVHGEPISEVVTRDATDAKDKAS